MNRKSCWLFLGGLIAGVTAGLLSTPKSGARHRAMISRKARNAASEVRDTVTGTVDRGKNIVKRSQKSVMAAMEAGRKTFTA